MTPSTPRSLPEDVHDMLAQAQAPQLMRLLQDIKTAAPVAKEHAKYDA